MLKRSIGMGINEQGLGPAARRAFVRLLLAASLYAPNDHVIVDVSANLLKIKDSVTPANDYYGQLYNPATFALNKFTFNRASSATRVNAAGLIETVGNNVPRIDYSRGYTALMMEGGRTNLLLYSNDLTNAAWVKTQTGVAAAPIVTANFAASPSGANDATRLQLSLNGGTAAGDICTLSQAPASTSGISHAGAIWVKANGAGEIGKVILMRGAAASAYKSVTLTGQWQRATTVEIASTAIANLEFGLRGSLGSADTADVLIWNGQSEPGAWPSSDIFTTTVAVTRAAETCTLSSALFTPSSTAHTLYADWMATNQNYGVVSIDSGANTNRVEMRRDGPIVSNGGVNSWSASIPFASNVQRKTAMAIASLSGAISLNGALSGTSSSIVLPSSLSVLRLGSIVDAPASGSFFLKEAAYFGSRLSDPNLQAITS